MSRNSAIGELRHRVHGALIEELGPVLYDKRLTDDDLRRKVHEALQAALAQERTPMSSAERSQLIQDVSDDILGYGPIDKLLRDEDVSEIMCNGPDQIFVERSGKLTLAKETFADDLHLRRIIDKIVAQVGRRIDESSPLCDARLADGSRVNAVVA
ncbi:MAG: ATPase, T2SS/T4P/T4SS family, partial [Actinomycetota bacterium]